MLEGRDFYLFLLPLMFIITSFSSFFLCVRGGKLSETEHFSHLIQAVDPRNVLMTRWNGTSSMLDLCIDRWTCIKRDFQTRSITEIRLERLNLSGILDVDSLCKLPSLRVLSLAKNLIKGTIPDSISNCTSLTHLNLSSNLLHGLIPMSLNNLKNLTSIDISNNSFSLKHYSKYIENPTNPLRIEAVLAPSNNSTTYSNEQTNGEEIKLLQNWIMLLFVIVLFALFLLFINKRSVVKAAKNIKKQNQQSLEDSSIKISPMKDDEEGETKPGNKEGVELVFFVDENERFKIEDLLQSAADLQGQSLCSSLYKVTLKNNAIFAVKRLKQLQVSVEEFGSTIRQIGKLKHPNVLSLVAYYFSNEEKLLIYKFQRNGSLLSLLEKYAEGKRDFPWRHRLSIAYGIAQGLDFIHRRRDHEGKAITHGNLKLSNILLNENEEPLISEYGFQRFLDPMKASLYYSNGYKAPEKNLTEEGDLYSYGMILLELLTGKTVERSGLDLAKWVKSMVREEWTGEVFDKEVNRAGKQWAFPLLNVALKCVSHVPENRPNIAEVLDKIEEVLNAQDDFSFSSTSSVESNQPDGCLLHTIIPESWETPGSGSHHALKD